MSVIGPRPQLVRDMVFMTPEQRRRHTAKPGLSGLAQVNGRNAISWEDKIEWDLMAQMAMYLDSQILCTINMKNFLLMEQREKESTDEHCERNSHGVVIYYKGILMDEIEFPDLGNEMIESIDIKGKLPREYINLNRRGFTEKGKAWAKQF